MNVQSINYFNKNSNYKNYSSYQFNKRYNLCFKSHDLLELSEKEVMDRVQSSINSGNFLGQGTEAEVYRIKDTNYCVRIPYIAQDSYRFNYSKELTPTDKVNHTVAKLGSGASIMKYFEGVTPKWYQNNNFSRYKLQAEIADMPVKSYSDFLHQIANAIDNEMFYDFSGGNLIIDTNNKKMTAIDFYGVYDNPRPINPLTEMYSVLTCYGSEKETGKKIFDKIVDAGLEEFKPDKIPCMDVELFDFVDLVLKRNSDNSGYKQGKISDDINMFNSLKISISEKLKTLKKQKKMEIRDKALSSMLMDNIMEFKNLITRIH